MFFSVTITPLFGLQACIGNYQKITNTNAAANKPPIYKNKGRHYFYNAIKMKKALRETQTLRARWL